MSLKGPKRVIVGVSGGIGGAVTAALLKSQGYAVEGAFLRVLPQGGGLRSEFGGKCCQAFELADAQQIASQLQIPLHVVDVEGAFSEAVMEPLLHGALANQFCVPCLDCTKQVKLAPLMAAAEARGFQAYATGHRVITEVDPTSGRMRVLRAREALHDESFHFLETPQELLRPLMTPLGEITQTMLFRLAAEMGLPELDSRLGDPLCFWDAPGLNRYLDLGIAKSLRVKGIARTDEGRFVGDHDGLFQFRYGQDVAELFHYKGEDGLVVLGFDSVQSALIVGPAGSLSHRKFRGVRAQWMRPLDPLKTHSLDVQFGPAELPIPSAVTLFENNAVQIDCVSDRVRAFPGMAFAVYQGDELLGGGRVERWLE